MNWELTLHFEDRRPHIVTLPDYKDCVSYLLRCTQSQKDPTTSTITKAVMEEVKEETNQTT